MITITHPGAPSAAALEEVLSGIHLLESALEALTPVRTEFVRLIDDVNWRSAAVLMLRDSLSSRFAEINAMHDELGRARSACFQVIP